MNIDKLLVIIYRENGCSGAEGRSLISKCPIPALAVPKGASRKAGLRWPEHFHS